MSRDFGLSELLFILQAMQWTVLLSLVAFVGGGILGFAVAVLRILPWAPARWAMIAYIQLFQGTPVLMQLFVAFYGLVVLFGLKLDPWPAVTFAFTAYSAAFLGEIWRGCIQAIPRTQWEAADCLALSYPRQLWHVVLPQAVRIALPPTVGFLVQLIKGTSIAAIIGFVELTRAGQLMVNVTFQPMTVYPVVALLYFSLCWPLSLLS
ncbi:MAG: amino acid ABC transporter permease, partial [Alphaproteobacteria bacterium]|nr:amino acid ABC transporter permease [Alphaproteobacteria bacterium]